MSKQTAHLVNQRILLIEQSTSQRAILELHLDDLRQPIRTIDAGMNLWKFIQAHPILIFSCTFALNQMRKHLVEKWLTQLQVFRKIVQTVNRIFND